MKGLELIVNDVTTPGAGNYWCALDLPANGRIHLAYGRDETKAGQEIIIWIAPSYVNFDRSIAYPAPFPASLPLVVHTQSSLQDGAYWYGDAPIDPAWTKLVMAIWNADAGDHLYLCAGVTRPEG